MPRLHSIVAGSAALSALMVLPMHQHPGGSTDRVSPGAVRVEAESHVSIDLLDDRSVLKHVPREYDTAIGNGSGFTVTPDGVIVTSTGVVQSDHDPRVYAANRVFAEYFKVKIPADYNQHKVSNPDLNARLQACYPSPERSATCTTTVTTKVTVYTYENSPTAAGLPAKVLHTGSSPASAAVLKLTKGGEDASLPTVPLGTTLGSKVEPTDLMTTPGRPTAKQPPALLPTHLSPPGSGTFKPEDVTKIAKALDADGDGGALIDDAKSEIVGLVTGGSGSPIIVTPVEDIQSALVAANVTPRRGPVDVVFETALASYHNKYYAASIPVFQQVLKLRNTHAVAADHLRIAQAKAGTAEDAATQAKPAAAPKKAAAISPWLWGTGAVVLLGLLVAVAVPLVMRRRRARDDESGPFGGPSGPQRALPPSSWPPQPTELMELAHPAEAGVRPSVPYPRTTDALPLAAPQAAPQGMQFCTQCGMRLGHAHRFCGFCGHPVEPS
jgi:hypothetical protein